MIEMCGVDVALYTKMEFNFYPERHEKPFKKRIHTTN